MTRSSFPLKMDMSTHKILIAFQAGKPSKELMDQANKLFHDSSTLLVAVFFWPQESAGTVFKEQLQHFSHEWLKKDNQGPRKIIHKLEVISVEELRRESKYADLIISDLNTTDSANARYLLEAGLHCPVLLIPPGVTSIKNATLLYDSRDASLDAIKQFCQLLNSLPIDADVNLLMLLNGHEPPHAREEEMLLIEYLKQHCKRLGIHKGSMEQVDKVLHILEFGRDSLVVSTQENMNDTNVEDLSLLRKAMLKKNSASLFLGTGHLPN